MELTPVVELQICTSSDNCEIDADNICNYNVGEQLNLDLDKQLYIAVKDVKVPLLERKIDFRYYYGKDTVWTVDGQFPDRLMKSCSLKFSSFEDLATMLMKTANKQLKPLFDEDPPKASKNDFVKVYYENERFHINIPYGSYLVMTCDICRLLGLYDEIYDAYEKEIEALEVAEKKSRDEAIANAKLNVSLNHLFHSSSVFCNFYSPFNSRCLFNFFDIGQVPRVVNGRKYSILFSYDMVAKKCVENSHVMFDIKRFKKDQLRNYVEMYRTDQLRNLRFSLLDESMKPFRFSDDLKQQPISFVIVIFSA